MGTLWSRVHAAEMLSFFCCARAGQNVYGARRVADCRGRTEALSMLVRADGEWPVIHQYLSCGELSANRIDSDDNALVLVHLPAADGRATGAQEKVTEHIGKSQMYVSRQRGPGRARRRCGSLPAPTSFRRCHPGRFRHCDRPVARGPRGPGRRRPRRGQRRYPSDTTIEDSSGARRAQSWAAAKRTRPPPLTR